MFISEKDKLLIFERLYDLEDENERLKRKIKKLECPHKDLKFIASPSKVVSNYGYCKCEDCEKILEQYESQRRFKEAESRFHEKRIKEIWEDERE